MNAFIRSSHRILAIVFTVAVLVNIASAMFSFQSVWIGLLALAPLALMMLSGLWLFVLPHLNSRGKTR